MRKERRGKTTVIPFLTSIRKKEEECPYAEGG